MEKRFDQSMSADLMTLNCLPVLWRAMQIPVVNPGSNANINPSINNSILLWFHLANFFAWLRRIKTRSIFLDDHTIYTTFLILTLRSECIMPCDLYALCSDFIVKKSDLCFLLLFRWRRAHHSVQRAGVH